MVPAALYIEMVCAAAMVVNSSDQVSLGNVTIERMLELPRTQVSSSKVVSLECCIEADGRFTVASDKSGSRVRHASGHVINGPANVPDPIRFSAVRARCTTSVDVAGLYSSLAGLGLRYGPVFRTLAFAWKGEFEACGLLVDLSAHTRAGFHVHPAVLDGVMH